MKILPAQHAAGYINAYIVGLVLFRKKLKAAPIKNKFKYKLIEQNDLGPDTPAINKKGNRLYALSKNLVKILKSKNQCY